MTDLKQAAQQALEAWEHINKYGFVLADYEGPMEQAITALRAALEQPEPEVKGCDHCNHPLYAAVKCRVCGRVTEPEQEPVAWMVYTLDGKSVCVTDNPADFTDEHRALPLYTHPPRRETEPAFDALVAISLLTHLGGEVADYEDVVEAVRRLSALNGELLEALRSCLGMLEQANCSTGYCCCGSSIDSHTWGDGHGPVDEGEHYQLKAIEAARAAIARAEGKV